MTRAFPRNQTLGLRSLLLVVSATCALHTAYCAEDATSAAMVAKVLAARQSQTPMPFLTKTYGSFSLREAYQVQADYMTELSKTLGPVVGYKVAYASQAARDQFGMKEPASGPYLQLQRVPSGSTLPHATFTELTLETEVAFTLGKRIDRPIKDVEELKGMVQWVHTALDVGDYRYINGTAKPAPQDMIACAVGAHLFVVGPAVDPRSVDIDSLALKLSRGDELLRDSAATNVLGSPWKSLLWLANNVVGLGGTLAPGEVILTGTAAPAFRGTGSELRGVYVGDCGPLGTVKLTIE